VGSIDFATSTAPFARPESLSFDMTPKRISSKPPSKIASWSLLAFIPTSPKCFAKPSMMPDFTWLFIPGITVLVTALLTAAFAAARFFPALANLTAVLQALIALAYGKKFAANKANSQATRTCFTRHTDARLAHQRVLQYFIPMELSAPEGHL